jgi:hypothetical protein
LLMQFGVAGHRPRSCRDPSQAQPGVALLIRSGQAGGFG